MNPVKIADYRTAEFPLIMEQYKNSPNLRNLIGVAIDEATNLEVALFELRDRYYLSFEGLPSAEGVQLDVIGSIYGEDRRSRDDAAYRTAIQIRALSRLSGTPNDIIFGVTVLLGANSVVYTPYYPAGFSVQADIVLARELVLALAPAGVGTGDSGFLVSTQGEPIVQQGDGTSLIIVTTEV